MIWILLHRKGGPLQVISPAAYPLDIEEMVRSDILGGDVLAPSPAAECKGWMKVVEDPAYSALRRRCIDHNPSCIHDLSKFVSRVGSSIHCTQYSGASARRAAS